MGSGEVLEIFSDREGDAFWLRHCPVAKAPKAKTPLHFTAPTVMGINLTVHCILKMLKSLNSVGNLQFLPGQGNLEKVRNAF
ncbi:hypothetical protein RTM1035_14937 [Roseovarius sp. TM1035]|jgi:hypothetical protein|nr:hypothetical protein RTM1035_14937 [Roseovarius sp. TM1035]